MIANYHTHTFRCGHAAPDDERIYIENAIKAGFTDLGFSDHCPMPLPAGYKAEQCRETLGVRMKLHETEDYVNTLLKLREEYKKDINIHIGFEVEYLPETFELFLDFISKYPIDYLLLGQHFDTLKDPCHWYGYQTRDKAVLAQYVDTVCAAMKTGKFTYLCHPDLCWYYGEIETYEREMTRLINCANEQKLPLEINFYGLQELRNYPTMQFWQLASRIGCDVVFGSDAHFPQNVCNETALRQSEELVRAYKGLNLIEKVDLVSPFKK
jgi:histidinol-phosphatase (PHP family)